MSDHDMPDRPDEDVAARLAGIHPVGPRAPRGGAAAARGRARRRQVVRTGGLAVAVAALVTAVPIAFGVDPTAAPPAISPTAEVTAPAPEPSGSAQPRPVPSGPQDVEAPRDDQSAEPSSGGTGGLDVRTTTSEPASAGVLADFDRPGRDTSGEGAFGGGTTWTFDPCEPTTWPADEHRTGWWAWNTYIGDSGTDYAVAVLDTEERAADALAGFARAAQACWGAPGDPDAATLWQTYPAGTDTVSGAARDYAPASPDQAVEVRGATWVGAVRQGRVVALVQRYDGYGGGTAAIAQGDTRPGTGASFYSDLTQQEAEAQVAERLVEASAEAARLAEEVSQHVGED